MSEQLDQLSKQTSFQLIVLIVTLILTLHSSFSDPLQTRQYLQNSDYKGQTILPVIVPLETTTSIMKESYNATHTPVKLKENDKIKSRNDYLMGVLKEGSLNKAGTTMTKTQISMLMHDCYGTLTSDQMLFLQKYAGPKYWGFRALLLQFLQDRNTVFDDTVHQNPTHGSHHICTCLKEFSIQTDINGVFPDAKKKFDHTDKPEMTDCQLQDLVYQSRNDNTMLEDYFSDVPTYVTHDFLHSHTIDSSDVISALHKAMNLKATTAITTSSTIEELLVWARGISVANYNKQYVQYDSYTDPTEGNWIEHSQTAGIKMCMHHAVPVFVSSVEEYVGVQVHYKLGEHLLLTAVFVAIFFMSLQLEAQVKKEVPNSNYRIQFVSFATRASKFVCALSIFGILFFACQLILNNKLERIDLKDEFYWTGIFGGFASDVLPLQIIASISLILWLVLALAFFFVAWTMFYAEEEQDKECTIVGCMVFDICIILGSAHMAVTMSVLRGITSSETILLVFLLVMSIGLLQHFSNLTMFVLQISKSVQLDINNRIAFHRFGGALLSAFMLWAVYALASTTFAANTVDVIHSQTSNFIFLLGLFFILHGYDIWVEAAVQFQAITEPYQVSSFVTKKHYYTGMLILVLIVFLNIQRYLLLCGKEDIHALDNQICKKPFAYIFGPMNNNAENHFLSARPL